MVIISQDPLWRSKLEIKKSKKNSSKYNTFLTVKRKKMNKTKVELTDTGIFVQILNPLTGRMEWKSQPEDYDYQQELARAAFAGQFGLRSLK